jgi:hypothetical protein
MQKTVLSLQEKANGGAAVGLRLNTRIRRRRSIAGQSVFVALAVLFLLAFLGAIFIAIIARNLNHTGRTTQTLNADYYAQAGINYANQMLETSPQGADWRPPLQNQLVVNALNAPVSQFLTHLTAQQTAAYTTAVNALGLQKINPNDPDLPWLLEGFSRYNVGTGRFLIRLSYVYDPTSGFPNSGTVTPTGAEKYIRIESIGRFGNVDPSDPTTFVNQPPTRLRAEMVAYKPIGLVDYARFITNKDNRPDTVNIGDPSVNTAVAGSPYPTAYAAISPFGAQAPAALQAFNTTLVTPNVVDFDPTNLPSVRPYPIITQFGQSSGYNAYSFPSAGNIGFGGGSFRANCNVRFYGANIFYLNPAIGDDIEIAGNMLFDRYNPAPAGAGNNAQVLADQQAQVDVFSQPAGAAVPNLAGLFPSNDNKNRFTTDNGLARVGSTNPDPNGFPNNIQRLDPPSLDTADPATGLTRYRVLTKVGTSAVNAGNPGTVYINNNSDIQTESQNIAGGYSLRDEWLDRTGPNAATGGNIKNWNADFYAPPGVVIRFGPIPNPNPPAPGNPPQPYLLLSNGEPAWGITMTRSDKDASGNPVFWPLANGNTGSSQTIYIVYAPTAAQAGEAPAPPTAPNVGYPYFNMNTENDPNATITAGQTLQDPDNDITIYAEGNVRVSGMVSDPSTNAGNTAFQHVTIVTNGIGYIDGSLMKGGPGYGQLGANNTPNYTSQSSVAVLAESYIAINTTQFLAGPTDFNLATSPTTPSAAVPFVLDFSAGQSLTEPVYLSQVIDFSGAANPSPLSLYVSQFTPAGLGATLAQGQAVFENLAGNLFTSNGLLPSLNTGGYGGTANGSDQTTIPITNATPGFPNINVNGIAPYQLTFSLPSANNTTGWDMEHAGIFPANARIEAILYAQNNSFFVIPGPWFNTNTQDTIFNVNAPGTPRAAGTNTDPSFPRFPMNGQPVDLQISIFGTVAENLPADAGDQAAWDQKWGWIPIYHGNLYPGNAQGAAAETSPVRDPNYAANIPQVGLNFSYDPMDGFDFINTGGAPNTLRYVRLDEFGRPLPVVPNLPVSTDLLYSGQSTNASVLP